MREPAGQLTCMNCEFSNDADAEFCENCGEALTHACANCGRSLKPRARFCKKCGTAIDSPTGTVTGDERHDRLAVLQRATPQTLQDKIRATAAQIESERKPVTILFIDIVGSTALAEKLDPEDWRNILMGAHQRISDAVYRYEGTIAQLLGDGVLAFFGAPITHEDDPVRAVRAGLDTQRSIEEYHPPLKADIDHFQLRAGINTGTVVVGNIGSDLHLEYTVIGDAVNLAARLQAAAQPGKILISEATARLVQAAFDLNALGEISVKGKAEPVRVFEVVDRKAAPTSGRGIEGLTSPLIGREPERAALNAALSELAAGHGQIVAVMGEAGIGKTRLVDEVRSEQPNQRSETPGIERKQPRGANVRNLRWLEGRALSYGQALSFWTITQLIKHDLGLSETAPEAQITAALRQRVTALFGAQADETWLYLAQVLGVKLDGEAAQRAERLRTLDAETLKRRVFSAIAEYFARVAQEQPTVLVFEDLHWADPSTLQVLESLLALTDRAPLMLLLLTRAEHNYGWGQIKARADTDYAHRYTELLLKPLSPAEQNQLIDQLLTAADLPAATRRWMLERSEGNPFYLEEVIRSLIEQGALVREANDWRATHDIAHVQLPTTLQGVLLARIDRLPETARRTLQLASVIGKAFLYRLLEALTEADSQLDADLAELQRADLIREKTHWPDLEYSFKHSLTQEAAYNSLLLERRKEFHRQVGCALESMFADRLEEADGLLAHHFSLAGEQAKAIEYANKAGDRARELFAYQEAIGYYQQALAGLKAQADYERAARTLMKIGLLYHTVFDFARSQQAYDEGLALWQRVRETTPEGPRPRAPHALRVVWRNPLSLDPGLADDTDSSTIIEQLFSGLIELTPDLDVAPEIARAWEVLDGGRKYVFHLRADARWSDGTAVTASDFEFAWKRVLAPPFGSRVAHLLYVIKGARAYHQGQTATPQDVGVQAVDDLTLAVELDSPTGYFLHLLTHAVTYPVPRQAVEHHGPAWTEVRYLVGNGAFLLEDWQLDQSLTLSRNPHYRGRFAGNAQRIEIAVVSDLLDRLEWYEADRLDATAVLYSRLDEIRQRHAAEYLTAPEAATSYVGFDVARPPFDDARVRRAFTQAIDRGDLANRILGGGQSPATGGFVPPCIPGHSAAIGLAYDPNCARQLLAEAGYPDGRGFPEVDLLTSYPVPIHLVEYLQAQWQEGLGVTINLRIAETWKEFHGHVLSKAPPAMYVNSWNADYLDADNFLRVFVDSYTRWRNETFDQLIEAASHLSDQAERVKLYQAADRLLIEEAAVMPLTYRRQHLLVKPWISQFRLSPMRTHWKDVIIAPH